MSAIAATRDELLADSIEQDDRALSERERRATLVVAGAFAVVAMALPFLISVPLRFDAPSAVIAVVAIALTSLARFDVASGFTVPVQLAFVPTLLELPAPMVPLIVAAGLVAGRSVDVLRDRARSARLAPVLSSAWFSVGPSVVLALGAPRGLPDLTPALAAVALAAQFGTDALASFAWERIVKRVGPLDIVRDLRWIYIVDLALSPVGFVFAWTFDRRPLMMLGVLPLLWLLSLFARERRTRVEQLVELNNAYRGTALVLGDVIEADDSYTGEHCRSVVALSLRVADAMGMPAERRRILEFGALLHDVGKVAIPNEIINKPGPLDPSEWSIVQAHTVEGQAMLDKVGGFMREVGRIVRSHHERWDGSGYPDGLAGERIPLESRIIGCCDAFNAMTTQRSYRKAMPVRQAIAEVRRCAGTQFDPQVVETLVRLVEVAHDAPVVSSITPLRQRKPLPAASAPSAATVA